MASLAGTAYAAYPENGNLIPVIEGAVEEAVEEGAWLILDGALLGAGKK